MLIGLDGSEEGYQNVASLLGWMRGNPVTDHNLDLALSNITNNIQFGRIHFKPQPRADRAYGPGGKLNHAFGLKDEPAKSAEVQQEFHRSGRRNHAYKTNTGRSSQTRASAGCMTRNLPVAFETVGHTGATLQARSGIQHGHRYRQILA